MGWRPTHSYALPLLLPLAGGSAKGMPRSDLSRLYKNVHKLMIYWYARIILEMDSNASNALKSNIHPNEFRAIRQHRRKMRYDSLRAQGLGAYEVRAVLDGTTPAIVKHRSNAANRRAAERLGGWPKAGTATYNRWLMAR